MAFSVASVHHLRDEPGVSHADLRSLLPTSLVSIYEPAAMASISVGSPPQTPRNLPLMLVKAMHASLNDLKASNGIDSATWSACQGALNQFTDQLTALERIRDTPIPTILQIQ